MPWVCHANEEKTRLVADSSKRLLKLMEGEDHGDERMVVAEEEIAPL
jgi:hypothetical protein